MQILNSKYSRWFFLGIVLFAIVFLPLNVSAEEPTTIKSAVASCSGIVDFFSHPFTCIVLNVSYGISYVVSYVFGVFLTLATSALSFVLELTSGVLDPDQNQVVFIGWTIVRDIANLGFVLVLVIVAIATILRRENYGYKKMLLKLIAAAILVNFSLTIAGVFVDFSNVLTNFFSSKIADNKMGIAEGIAGAFSPQRLIGSTGGSIDAEVGAIGSTLLGFGSLFIQVITSLSFANVFFVLAIFTILTLAAMLLLRYLHITFLVIISPIVWLFWVIPHLENQFTKWWSNFVKWIFFAPASMFFIYLALFSMERLGKTQEIIDGSKGFFSSFGQLLTDVLSQGTQMMLLTGIMLGGLIVAQKMSIGIADAAIKLAKTTGKAVLGGIGSYTKDRSIRYAKRGVDLAGSSIETMQAPRKAVNAVQGFGEKLHNVGANRGRVGRFFTAPLTNIGGRIYRGAGAARQLGYESSVNRGARRIAKERKLRDPSYVPPEGIRGPSIGSFFKESFKKEFKPKKKRKLSPQEQGTGYVNVDEPEENEPQDDGGGGGGQQQPRPLIVNPNEEDFRDARDNRVA